MERVNIRGLNLKFDEEKKKIIDETIIEQRSPNRTELDPIHTLSNTCPLQPAASLFSTRRCGVGCFRPKSASPPSLPTLPAFRVLFLLSQLAGATDSTRSFGWPDESRREAGWPPTATRRSRGRRRRSPPRPPVLEPTIWTTRSSCAASVCEFVADAASPFPSLIPLLSSGYCRSFCDYGGGFDPTYVGKLFVLVACP